MQRYEQPVQDTEGKPAAAEGKGAGEEQVQWIQQSGLCRAQDWLARPGLWIPQRQVAGVNAASKELQAGNLELAKVVMIEPDVVGRISDQFPIKNPEQN